ncbi:YkgJ family cysteine cluster protein [Geofilum sp. OHC36d9]|uniref:YkgJ family cysteine cluster protein n=1 Tax=Geofilum sp. OHC36d9 TaxID=3458413 RepID=UPI004034C0D1
MQNIDDQIEALHIEGLRELVDYYGSYDRQISEVREKYNFHCVNRCGACCMTPSINIEVSTFEMIPMAIEIIHEHKDDLFLKSLDASGIDEIPCVIYQKTSLDGREGYCSRYGSRPLICRLFGGGTRMNKNAQRELILCRLLKKNQYISAESLAMVTQKMPLSSEVSTYVRGLNSDIDPTLYAINVALKKALEYILFKLHWLNPEAPEPGSPPFGTPPGHFPVAA